MSSAKRPKSGERIRFYIDAIKKLPLDSYKKDLLSSNFIENLRFMEALAKRNLLLQDISNVIVIVLSALVPVIINYSSDTDVGDKSTPIHLVLATILSVILAIFNALRQSYKFREKWISYRRTAELLVIEGQNYFALSCSYIKYSSHDEAFPYFISAISNLSINQLNDYIKTALSESDAVIQQRIQVEVNKQTDAIQKKTDEINTIKEINNEVKDFVKAEPAISYDEIDHQRKLITLFTNDSNYKAPEKFNFKNKSLTDLTYKIAVETSDAKIYSMFGISSGIQNPAMNDRYFGSTGCFCLQAGKVVFVTCYHVVKDASHEWDLFVPNGNDEVTALDGINVGTILEGAKTDEIDAAIVEVSGAINYENLFPGQLAIQDIKLYLDEENYINYQQVYIISRTRGYKKIKGNLSCVGKHISLDYGEIVKDMKDLDNIIFVHSVSTEPFSKPGDSGSLVFTDLGEPIGILVGADGARCSFVIPYSSIADYFNLSIL